MYVTLQYCDQIGRNTSKIIPRLISIVFSVCMDHSIMDLLKREHHEISVETGICVTYLIQFAFKSAVKHNLFCSVKYINCVVGEL